MALSADPLVSVVIPTWNRLPLLREAVASVQAQSYANWELVVVDDGSDDGSAEWVRGLGDPRIRVLVISRLGHLGSVRNRGAAQGRGELLAFLDSDDLWVPQKLAIQVAALRESGLRWCYSATELTDAVGNTIPMHAQGEPPASGWIAEAVLVTRLGVNLGTLLLERTLFEECGGLSEDPRLVFRGDHEFGVRLALRAPALGIRRVLTRVREHPTRSTAALTDPSERSARVYDLFLEGRHPRELRLAARRSRSQHRARAATRRRAGGENLKALRLWLGSLLDRLLVRWSEAPARLRGGRGQLEPGSVSAGKRAGDGG